MTAPTASICASCAGRLPSNVTTCPFCRAATAAAPPSRMPITRSVHDAATTWARRIFGAPRDFADLITAIEVRDEILERVVSEVVRREVREQRTPCNRRD